MNRKKISSHRHHRADHGRYIRQGFPEAIYGPGKTTGHIVDIARDLSRGAGPVLVTRVGREVFEELKASFPGARYNETARMIMIKEQSSRKRPSNGRYICVVTGGTTDIPVAEEAAATAEALGTRVHRIYDVGVAGIHRLLEHRHLIEKASCVIACAGMEGALASVVGGLAASPVIGVPTSVGYGTAFGGVAALLSMLNSCAANVSVVNIDDGFGAGVIASLIDRGGKGSGA